MLTQRNMSFRVGHFFILFFVIFTLLANCIITINPAFGQSDQSLGSSATTRGSRAYDFEIEFDTSILIIDPNTEQKVNLNLDNTGDQEDTYDLSFSQIPLRYSNVPPAPHKKISLSMRSSKPS